MKKVLVTGAAGNIGTKVIKYLLSEGRYEITALDLKNRHSYNVLKKYKKRINILYGDVCDSVLIDALIKGHDYVIHLAGVLPPMADIKSGLCHLIDYKGTENIVRAIDFYNPNCFLIYASTTAIYGENYLRKINTKAKVVISENDYYSKVKYETENMIKKNIKCYTIFRLPLILTDPAAFIYNGRYNEKIEVLSDLDAAYAFVKAIENKTKLKGKTFNLGGGKTCQATYQDIVNNILHLYGLNFRYLFNRLFIDKNFYGHIYEDSEVLEEILHYRSDSILSYYMRMKRKNKKRIIQIFLAKPLLHFKTKKGKLLK